MEFRLKILGGNKAGQEVVVKPGKFFIGRAEDCHLRPHSDLISRHHCVFTHAEDYTSVRDFGSKNGTYVNGERVESERELRAGDRLKIGPLDFEVVLEARVGGAKKPAVSDVREAVSRFAGRQDSSTDDVGDWLSDSSDDSQDEGVSNSEAAGGQQDVADRGASTSETMAISNSETVIGTDELRLLLDAASHLHDEETIETDSFVNGTKQDDSGQSERAGTGDFELAAEANPSEAAGAANEGSPTMGPPASEPASASAYPIPGVSPGSDAASPYAGGFPPGAGGMPGGPGGPYPGYPYPPQFAQQGMPYGYWPQPGMPQAAPQQGGPQQGMPPQGMPQHGAYPPGVTPPYGYPPQFYPGYGMPYGFQPQGGQPQGGQGEAPPPWPGFPGPPQGYPGQQHGPPTAPMMGRDGPQFGPPAPHFSTAPSAAPEASAPQAPTARAPASKPPATAQAKATPPSEAPAARAEPAPPPPSAPARKPNYFVPDQPSADKKAEEKEAAKNAKKASSNNGNSGDAAADTLRKLFSRR